MISKACDVDAYIDEVPSERRSAIVTLRNACRENLIGYEECIEYGMPCYKRNGVPEISFASQKNYIAFYVMKKDVLDHFRDALSASSIGKGCVRFAKPGQMNFEVIRQLLQKNAGSTSAPC
jgi:uncharacterized protein YdhG (YjbR/CyaY superfamily)